MRLFRNLASGLLRFSRPGFVAAMFALLVALSLPTRSEPQATGQRARDYVYGDRRLLATVSGIEGSGTLNRVAKFTTGNATIGDSAISEVNGLVGIGTSTPQGQLHIFGLAGQDLFAGMGPDLTGGPAFNFGYAGGSFGRSAGFFNIRPDASAAPPNPSLRFHIANLQRMIITNTGAVGIGDNLNPASGAKLHVDGAVRATSFIANGTTLNVPDYVFEPEYRLMSMSDLRAYVRRERRLPGVPGAEEVRKDGLDVTRFQLRLLEKVEELTLHVLNQHEQIDGLQSANRQLRTENKALQQGYGDRIEELEARLARLEGGRANGGRH
jgi:hypothetical protein